MAYYVLTIELTVSDKVKEYLTFNIEADDRQMVKYHFHHTFKDWGFSDTSFGKHCLENWHAGILKEIYEIQEIDRKEYEILDKYMYSFHKTAEH